MSAAPDCTDPFDTASTTAPISVLSPDGDATWTTMMQVLSP